MAEHDTRSDDNGVKDNRVDDLDLLTGPDAHDLLATAVATAGGDLLSWTARQVDHRPGASTTVSYRARVRIGGTERSETLGAAIGLPAVGLPDGVLRLSDGGREVTVWRFPHDPGLPALAAANEPVTLTALLTSFGIRGLAQDGSDVTVSVRAYRPRRRAVLQVRAGAAMLFVKVLRPGKVQALHQRHDLLHDAGLPVPRSLGWTDDGVLMLSPLPGRSLRAAYRSAEDTLPTHEALTDPLDRLPEAAMHLPRRRPWADHAGHYAAVVGACMPAEAGRAHHLGEVIAADLGDRVPDASTHGDYYEAQLLVESGSVVGVLDVDTAGPGRRADDLGCLLAHADVLGSMWPESRTRLDAAVTEWLSGFARSADPRETCLSAAGVMLSLATGPHRVQESGWQASTSRRLDLVERWVERAHAWG